ncbi:MAG TPA: hypothetical protein VFU97_24605 [Xanthobacteraceae bacterium]|nr:hypothetical protein [Xanthobacteraceae bacterium]
MRWEDERYVRLYCRDTPEWTLLCWQARALHPLILKELDRAGLLELGKSGVKALASKLRLPLEFVRKGLEGDADSGDGLLTDGCVSIVPDGRGGEVLWMRNYLEAQEASQSDAQRKRAARERASARAKAASIGLSQNVTGPGDPTQPSPPTGPKATGEAADASGQVGPAATRRVPEASRNVPQPGQVVTSGHSVLSLTDQRSRSPAVVVDGTGDVAPTRPPPTAAAPTAPRMLSDDEAEMADDETLAPVFLCELCKHEQLKPIADPASALALARRFLTQQTRAVPPKLSWALNSIGAAAADIASQPGMSGKAVMQHVRGYVENCRAPREPRGPAPAQSGPRIAYGAAALDAALASPVSPEERQRQREEREKRQAGAPGLAAASAKGRP